MRAIAMLPALAAANLLFPGARTARVSARQAVERPFLESELVFPLEYWHNHASMIVEAPDGSLLMCGSQGGGKRPEADVVTRGGGKKRGARDGGPLSLWPD